MKIKLIAAIGGAIEAFVDYVGLRNFICGVIGFGFVIFLPVIIKAMK